MLYGNFRDENTGTLYDLEGESVSEIFEENKDILPGTSVTIYDEAGFVRGWISSEGWRAQ